MQILEAALAFAITMLVLSLVCSSFVEIIHRIFSMREAGLKYVLGQMFDQVLAKYFKPDDVAKLVNASNLTPGAKSQVEAALKTARASFVERMSSNRVPMGVTPNLTPTDAAAPQPKPEREISLWSGRDLTSLTPKEFMERLGSLDVSNAITEANKKAGEAAADMVDAVLKDIAQKFEAFGKEASVYFEGRARLLSVCVAIVLAFAMRVDAVELFNTYLRDPNARNKVIEQSQAVTAQYKAQKEAADALQKVAAASPTADIQKQIDDIKKDWQAAVDNARTVTKQYADLGLPIGWTKENASLNPWAKTCTKDGVMRVIGSDATCAAGETAGTVGCWMALTLASSLLLGGILIGLGGPFWYDAVTGLTNIRNIAREVTGADTKKAAGAAPPDAKTLTTPPLKTDPDEPQPATPVGAFTIAQAGQAAR